MIPQHHLPADIERTSLSIITTELEALGLTPPPETAAVVKRVIHTTADFDYAKNLRFTPGAVAAGVAALRAGTPIITDTNMALSGISKPALARLGGSALCYMADPEVARIAAETGTTRAVASMHRAAQEHPGAILAVGNAPHRPAGHCGRDRGRAAACPGHRRAGGLCECGGKQGSAVCRLCSPRCACHRGHGPQGRQHRGRRSLQRSGLLRRRDAGPSGKRVEIGWNR